MATVRRPSSLAARRMRMAISLRLRASSFLIWEARRTGALISRITGYGGGGRLVRASGGLALLRVLKFRHHHFNRLVALVGIGMTLLSLLQRQPVSFPSVP